MTDEPRQEPAEDAMRARLEKLSTDLAAQQAARPAQSSGGGSAGPSDSSAAMAKGLRAASELVAGIVVGGFIGWQLDSWLGTKPWLSILFFLLGVCAGFWNVMRAAFKPTGGGSPQSRA